MIIVQIYCLANYTAKLKKGVLYLHYLFNTVAALPGWADLYLCLLLLGAPCCSHDALRAVSNLPFWCNVFGTRAHRTLLPLPCNFEHCTPAAVKLGWGGIAEKMPPVPSSLFPLCGFTLHLGSPPPFFVWTNFPAADGPCDAYIAIEL